MSMDPSPGNQRETDGRNSSGAASSAKRLAGLDALRGFALAGIILVNIPVVLHIGVSGSGSEVREWLDIFVQERFFPIFSLLFGVGFGMLWRTAGAKTGRPRWALLRRLLFLGVLGGLHQLLQPGEALLPYAICGLIFLLPVTLLPDKTWTRRAVGIGGVVLLIAGLLADGGLLLIPGLFLIGFAAGTARIPARMAQSPLTLRVAAGVGITGIIGSAALLALTSPEQRGTTMIGHTIGLIMAATYIAVFMALLHTPVRTALTAVFAPLGRMALTNYVTATLLMIAIRLVTPSGFWARGDDEVWFAAMAACVGILAVQWAWSFLWLRRFGQGPLERLWRRVTWWDWSRAGAAAQE